MSMKNYVTYEAFGAVGNGVTDDMPAIVKAHEYANENGLPVKARAGATYYIGGEALTAVIKTDTDFTDAAFIIDDTVLKSVKSNIFSVRSDFPLYTPELHSIAKGATQLSFPHEGRTYVRVFNSEKKIFRRKGENANTGVDASDCFVVDGSGAVESIINYDYPVISKIYAKCVDDNPITVKGGSFTTIANRHERVYNYHKRGFEITRSNVTLKGISHYIEGEGDDGAPYAGFFSVSEAVNVTIEDCLLTPHKTYMTKDSVIGGYVNRMGSYELSFNASINLRLLRVTQSRDITDTNYWGLIGTNFCKDIYIEDSVMSRFDAHMGVTGTTIKRTRIGHQCLSLIGYGDFHIEDSYVIGYSLVNLRGDYGSVWNGTITIKNCTWHPLNPKNLTVINADNDGTHDFGYVCHMPSKITIDGLRILDAKSDTSAALVILPSYDKNFSKDKPFRYIPVKELKVRGVSTECGRTPVPYTNKELYDETVCDIEI